MQPKSTTDKRQKILDIAETLFAHSGFDGVSVREITDKAGIRLASVNYYFGTKENLYFEVLARRAIIVVQERKRRLDQINFEKLTNTQAITEITLAVAEPLMQRVMSGDQGWQSYFSVIANFAAKPLASGQQAPEMNELDKFSLEFIEALCRHSSSGNERKAHHAFQFITGATLSLFANNGRLNTLSEGRFRSDDYESMYQDGIDFIVGGVTKILIES